jgi:heme A synthase
MAAMSRLTLAAGLGLSLMLVVVAAAASIRLGIGVTPLRVVHRAAASLEVVVVLWLGWRAWRTRAYRPELFRAALLAVGLTVMLSIIGIVAGQDPPPAAATANLLGGLALTAVFAWILGAESGSDPHRMYRGLTPILAAVLIAIQLFLGARLAIVDRIAPALPAHALLAIALAALLGWVGLSRVPGRAGKALFALALATPLAGFTSLHYEYSAAAALVHAAAAALLVVSSAYALSRGA